MNAAAARVKCKLQIAFIPPRIFSVSLRFWLWTYCVCFSWNVPATPYIRNLPFSELVSSLSGAAPGSAQGLSVRAWIRCVLQQHLHKNPDGTESKTGNWVQNSIKPHITFFFFFICIWCISFHDFKLVARYLSVFFLFSRGAWIAVFWPITDLRKAWPADFDFVWYQFCCLKIAKYRDKISNLGTVVWLLFTRLLHMPTQSAECLCILQTS